MVKEKLISLNLVEDNEYLSKYCNLIDNCIWNEKLEDVYYEKHHIVPRYYFRINGLLIDNSDDNLVLMDFASHVLAHFYLYMCSSVEDYKDANLYAIVRMLGKLSIDLSEEQIISHRDELLSARKEFCSNPKYHQGMRGKKQSEYHKIRMRETARKWTDEQKIAKSKSMVGNSNASGGSGMIFIHKGDEQKRITEDQLDKFMDLGFKVGKSDKIKLQTKIAYKEKYANGTYVNKDGKDKFIANDEIENYLHMGFKIGKAPYSKERCQHISEKKKGSICINDGVKNKYVQPVDLQKYLDSGFKIGRLKY